MNGLKQKLSSRKLWAAVIAAALCVISAIMGEEITPESVELIHAAVLAAVAYIFGESAVDVFRQIGDALKEKYKLPEIGEILDEIEKEENSEQNSDE